jgi:hypothetical protein
MSSALRSLPSVVSNELKQHTKGALSTMKSFGQNARPSGSVETTLPFEHCAFLQQAFLLAVPCQDRTGKMSDNSGEEACSGTNEGASSKLASRWIC